MKLYRGKAIMQLSGRVVFSLVALTVVIEANDSPCSNKKYRTFDGSCNNLAHPTWGMGGTTERRFYDDDDEPLVAYEDGDNIPRGGIPSTLPSPRAVTNLISDESLGPKNQADKKRSGQSFAQGQTLAHDLVDTKLLGGIDCCNPAVPQSSDKNICFPFYIPDDDGTFTPESCTNFVRAPRASDSPESLQRDQINQATSFVDASFLYGSSDTKANIVRETNSFLLKSDNGSLPTHPEIFADFCQKQVPVDRCPFAGDPRVSDAPNLYLNHLVWLKEHNRIAQTLHELNLDWDNEKVFQETRKIIIAMWQHITYNEYLPNVVGAKTMATFNLFSKNDEFDDEYDEDVDPSIRNGFAVAALRFGHSQVVREQSLLAEDYKTKTVNKLEDNFLNPHLLQINNGVNLENYVRWLTSTSAMKIDNFIVDSLRSKLFVNIDPPGQDLMSRNIQRGRDHGIPGYNKWREFCGYKKMKNFGKFGKFGEKLEQLYDDVDDVDLMVGGLLEKGQGGAVGETFSCIMGKQFQLLKRGDRYWYERSEQDFSFTKAQLQSIKDGSLLSKVFCRNFNLEKIQKDIFSPGKESKLVDCDDIPDVNLDLWKD